MRLQLQAAFRCHGSASILLRPTFLDFIKSFFICSQVKADALPSKPVQDCESEEEGFQKDTMGHTGHSFQAMDENEELGRDGEQQEGEKAEIYHVEGDEVLLASIQENELQEQQEKEDGEETKEEGAQQTSNDDNAS